MDKIKFPPTTLFSNLDEKFIEGRRAHALLFKGRAPRHSSCIRYSPRLLFNANLTLNTHTHNATFYTPQLLLKIKFDTDHHTLDMLNFYHDESFFLPYYVSQGRTE